MKRSIALDYLLHKRTIALIVMFAGLSMAAGCASGPNLADMHANALRLGLEDGICSGTAVGPHEILTARHCFNHKLVSVNGQPAEAQSFKREGKDAVVVTVSTTFDRWAKRGPRPVQGDRLRFIGNPVGEPDVYREALVARAWTDGLILETTLCPGDSGAGLIDGKGRVVGVVSAMTGDRICRFGLAQ
jgi:hypothetical protein